MLDIPFGPTDKAYEVKAVSSMFTTLQATDCPIAATYELVKATTDAAPLVDTDPLFKIFSLVNDKLVINPAGFDSKIFAYEAFIRASTADGAVQAHKRVAITAKVVVPTLSADGTTDA